MARVTWTARLRPEKIEEYVTAHAAVWPEMLAMIKEAGVRNYSIHLFKDRVFGYYECDDPAATQAFMRDAEVTVRWNAAMAPLFAPEVATEGLIAMPEVFRLD
ncbi:MAG: L-rhamnose mutarotase [Chloroflexota bacterium]